ncbi:MAG: hypothetical protein PHY93_02975 [Bacteriovorax sp.]|nr:hypothetical protein [Bacteriovorax sp.]
MQIFNKMLLDLDRRCSGAWQKKRTFFIQFLSALIFIVMGLIIGFAKKNLFFAILFLSEGMGQFFLAKENQKSLREGDIVITYFKKNSLGFFAALSFSFTMVCRYCLAANYLLSFNTTLMIVGGILSTLIYLSLYLFSSLKKDTLAILSAIVIMISSILLGLFSLLKAEGLFDYQLAINQFSYASLLLLGALFLRPWVAEALNIIIWALLFLFTIVN